MCSACVMAAAAGATGTKSWLQSRHLTWLTPRRMRAVTTGLVVAAIGVSSVGLSGSGSGHAAKASAGTAAAAQR